MTAWSRVLPPVEGGGPGCSAAGERRNFFGMLGLGPPALRSARCGPCPAARPPLRACSRPGPLRPPGPRWPWLGPPPLPLGRCGGRFGLSAGRLRPSARSRCSPGGPRCGVGGSGRGRACLAPASAPGVGVVRSPLRAAAGSLRGCSPLGCSGRPFAPSAPRRCPLPGPLSGGPAIAMGRRAFLPPGGAGGGLRPPFAAPRPPPLGYQTAQRRSRVQPGGQGPPLTASPGPIFGQQGAARWGLGLDNLERLCYHG